MYIGSQYLGDRTCKFTLWAPLEGNVAVHLVSPEEKIIPLQKDERGYWQGTVNNVEPGCLYFYQLDGQVDRADSASHFQPQGVHGPSQVVDHSSFSWTDAEWQGIPLEQMVIYELHVSTFTEEGTFESIIPRIAELLELGINAIEIMPVAQFPGDRNWGYDGTFPYAVQNSYGGVDGLKKLVDACHQQGMAVILDVVYNHLGPEGNYLWGFGTYFTDHYKTPWGSAVNFDGSYSDGVRNYFVQNALYWLETFHIDCLRLDAVHAIYDFGAKHILAEIAEAVAELSQRGYKRYLIAESDLNDPRIIRSPEVGGYGIDAQWSDDFHHALHTVLTGENQGYYKDFGQLEQLAKAYREGFVYTWDYSPHRHRYHGNEASGCFSQQFVVCSQNHDQVGNRMMGDRLTSLISFEGLKLTAAAVLLSPYVPLLFMGEEYGETAPFLYFVSHSDPDLIKGVREGRKAEFAAFFEIYGQEAPDPQAVETMKRSRLNWEKRHEGKNRMLWLFYQKLLKLRREIPALANLDRHNLEASVIEPNKVLQLRRWCENNQVLCWLNFSQEVGKIKANIPSGPWKKQLDSADSAWGGDNSQLPEILDTESQSTFALNPESVVVYCQ
ncbi:MAG: malto-oligosyltrehalose trehalohydrolase [Pelatocladus maniniholoensis HA4357-MV3]|jgi:maltooligosyltrehalose trehalohydrolase|uniref:Malto-oligosyltrehalose trehalohydrolase n=1 Tax=Pelatocladus maniniholoensis HA4357-MV3 TaxID=1117104 RepID=A0A9E3HAP2_9NOST|nr:malto-oligosyltrehalose trehalohydrolase [Pelatocladus maniniholoensis HA4357-MV3]BAZ69709.1 malto-oligosyltrehalose trehalohydrolase [Fischerella sp. NIES-4106]